MTVSLQQRWLFLLVGRVTCDGGWSCTFISGERESVPEEGIVLSTQLNMRKRAVYMWPTNDRYKYNNLLLWICMLYVNKLLLQNLLLDSQHLFTLIFMDIYYFCLLYVFIVNYSPTLNIYIFSIKCNPKTLSLMTSITLHFSLPQYEG